ncbi:MAG: flagellar filament capping protein FliD [Oscillospiraceae bacterium]|nr:flagellar filament capping protein FliD [Oscillospiraceae bacterium]
MSTVQNTSRLTGLFSGIDTDALVKAMTMQQQRKVDLIAAKRTQAEWKRDHITEFNNKLRLFRDTYGSLLGSDNLMSRNSFTSFSVDMASNTGVSVTASATAKAGSYNVRVDRLATAASLRGSKLTARSTGLTAAEVNSTSIRNLSGAISGGGYQSDGIQFEINGREFNFSATATLKSIMDEVNKAGIGVTMAYSQTTDSVTVTSDTLGAASELSFSDNTGFLAYMGISGVTAGQDALVYINGETEARSVGSNSITLDGITMGFLRTTGPGGVDFTLEADYKPTIDRIQKMVDSYNTLIKELYTAHTQKVNRDYLPLTEEQKAEMTQKEIEEWELKAKEGLLSRDRELGRLLEGMRSALAGSFGSNGTLASIGITTSRYVKGEPVQLQIDEDKLMAALKEDPDRVYNMFSAAERDGGGLMTRLNKAMDDYVNTTRGRELQNLNNNIIDYNKRIKEQENKLTIMGERYYLQYARLETLLGQMMSQQDSLATMFGWNNNQ